MKFARNSKAAGRMEVRFQLNVKYYLLTTKRTRTAEAKKAALRKVEMSLDEADEMVSIFHHYPAKTHIPQVSQMQIEIQGIPKSMKPTYSARLKNAQSELTRYKKLSKDVHAQVSRSSLFSFSAAGTTGRMSTSDEPYADDRTRLLAGTDVLDDGMR
jgi:vesicle transport through interaction with t-SNAREs protein 1